MTTATANKVTIEVGSRFGYREVTQVTPRRVYWRNLNGRRSERFPNDRPIQSATREEFLDLIEPNIRIANAKN